jgi:molybdenum cofactor biosynthesis enzyme MoaA
VDSSTVSMAATTANPAAATDGQAMEAEERAGALRQFRDLARTLKIDHHTKAQFETITRSMDQEAIEQVRSAVRQGLSKAEIDQIIVDRLRLCDIVEGYERAKELRAKLAAALTSA